MLRPPISRPIMSARIRHGIYACSDACDRSQSHPATDCRRLSATLERSRLSYDAFFADYCSPSDSLWDTSGDQCARSDLGPRNGCLTQTSLSASACERQCTHHMQLPRNHRKRFHIPPERCRRIHPCPSLGYSTIFICHHKTFALNLRQSTLFTHFVVMSDDRNSLFLLHCSQISHQRR